MPEHQEVFQYLRKLIGSAGEIADGDLLERFVHHDDNAAFEEVLRRHGPMVLALCRRIVRQPQDSDDAYQATFLVLVRKAGSLLKERSVAGWLYGVAYRTALRVRAKSARWEAATEKEMAMIPDELGQAPCWNHLYEEVQRLPEKQRTPVVLCYLEGRTYDEVAQQLGCPKGTLSTRLTEARELLRRRLSRHGVQAGLLAALLPATAQAAPVPAELQAATLRLASLWKQGRPLLTQATAGPVVRIADGVLRELWVRKAIPGVCLLLALGLAGSVLGLAALERVPEATPGHVSITDPSDASLPAPTLATRRLVHGQGAVKAVAVSADGRFLASAGTDRIIRIHNLEDDRLVHELKGHGEPITTLAFAPDGLSLVSGCLGNTIRVWDLVGGKELRQFRAKADVFAVRFTGDGKKLAVATTTDVTLVDLVGNVPPREFEAVICAIQGLQFSKDDRLLAGAGHKKVFVWDGQSGKLLRTFRLYEDSRINVSATSVAFVANERCLAAGSNDGLVWLWDLTTGKLLCKLGGSDSIFAVAASPDGQTLAATSSKRRLLLWKLQAGDVPDFAFQAEEPGSGHALAFAPDGSWLAVGGDDGFVYVRKLTTAD